VLAVLLSVCVCACRGDHGSRPSPVVLDIGLGLGIDARPVSLGAFLQYFYAESLVSVGWEGRPSPRLVESWEWYDDHKVLKLYLRQGVKFHDGTPLTAGVLADILRQQIAKGDLPAEFVTGVSAADDRTVVISLSRPDAFFLEQLSNSPAVLVKNPEAGTGPFQLLKGTTPATLQAFASYYRGRAPIDEIRVHTYTSQRAAWAAMLRGEVEYLHEVSRDAVDFVEAQSSVHSYPYLAPYYIPIVFNMQHPVLRNVEVRRALNQAIDREKLVSKAMHNRARPADGPIWPQFWAVSSAQRTYTFNPEAAGIRLDAAGYPLKRATDTSHMARRFHFTCLYWSDGPQYERIALIVQKQLFDIGVDVDMQPLAAPDLFKRIKVGDYDAFMVQMSSGRALSWAERFWDSRNQPAVAQFNNHYASADATFARLRLATSEEQTREGVAELQRIMFDDPPAAFLVWLMSARALSTKFDVPTDEPSRDILSNAWQWRLAAPTAQAAR
jgi:peptide/nickel transport system substrate-binding protein